MGIVDTRMTASNLTRAHTHVKNVCALGTNVTLVRAGTKDEFGAITVESTISLKSFPTRYAPYDRKVLEKISWAEETEVLCYVSKSAIDDLETSLDKLKKKYRKMRIANRTYEVRFIEYYNAFADDFLYVIIGGKK